MLNKEKYVKEIAEIALNDEIIALKDNKPINCRKIKCNDCERSIISGCSMKKLTEWANSKYKEQILDEVEKEYLKAVIKPFKKHVKTIMKAKQVATLYAITIDIEEKYNYETFLQFPPFEKSSGMYQGMELGKRYTLEELGLWVEWTYVAQYW